MITMPDLTAIILTYNEERHIERAIKSVEEITREVFVIDSFSTDRTMDIVRASGTHVLQHGFINQAKQFQWALDNAPIATEWVMRLDADEIIETDLAAEIGAQLSQLPADVTGINLKRKHIFMGRWIKHGGAIP